MKDHLRYYCIVFIFLFISVPAEFIFSQNSTLYVAVNGSDTNGNGSESNPWATMQHAIDNAAPGNIILLKPGQYTDVTRLNKHFNPGITIRSELPYQARLRANETVIKSFGGSGFSIEGFDISHGSTNPSALIIQIGDSNAFDIHFKNNILHNSYNNDILKINNGSHDITVIGNIFYNQQGSDEHIDINSVRNVEVYDNVFFNDFEGSGRTNNNDTSSFIVIKDSNGNSDGVLGSENITVARNVFLNYQGSTATGFIFVGEDGTSNFEAMNVLIENNLMIGNSTNRMKAPLGVHGSKDVTFRNNTVSGNLVAQTFAIRVLQLGSNMPSDNVFLYNNIWSDPTGTMGISGPGDTTQDFSDTPPGELDFFEIDNNLYWNGGQSIPVDQNETVNFTDDANSFTGDPLLGSQGGIILPIWNQGAGNFADGSETIRDVFENLINLYGIPGQGSPAINSADSSNSPGEDILGNLRMGNSPDIGAVEINGQLEEPENEDEEMEDGSGNDDDDSETPESPVNNPEEEPAEETPTPEDDDEGSENPAQNPGPNTEDKSEGCTIAASGKSNTNLPVFLLLVFFIYFRNLQRKSKNSI